MNRLAFMNGNGFFLSLFVIAIIFMVPACSDDEEVTSVSGSSTGNVFVNPSPDDIGVQWVLTGPDEFHEVGIGHMEFLKMPLGEYTIQWGDRLGWFTPEGSTRTLYLSDAYAHMNGRYDFMGEGTIDVNVEPSEGLGQWQIDGPDTVDFTGQGDIFLEGLVPGSYRLTWDSVDERITPTDSTLNVVRDETTYFFGRYENIPQEMAGMAIIPPVDVLLPAGFIMGDSESKPHDVYITGRTYMSETEIANQEFVQFLNWGLGTGEISVDLEEVNFSNGVNSPVMVCALNNAPGIDYSGSFSTSEPQQPMGGVTWYGAALFCNWKSGEEGLEPAYEVSNWSCNGGEPYAAVGYRLPTEAEWEFACAAGTSSMFYSGDCISADSHGNFDGSAPQDGCSGSTNLGHVVDGGQYGANPWGLFDMYGNVAEWCNDWFGGYDGDTEINPTGALFGEAKMTKGGHYLDLDFDCRAARRTAIFQDTFGAGSGIRVIRTIH